LLVRADFVLKSDTITDRRVYKRWRRIFIDALPRLLGCEHRCPQAERVRLHIPGEEGRFTAWLRIPIQRRPSRRRIRKFKARLRARLEAGLLPPGRVLKVGVRRCRPRAVEVAPPAPVTPVVPVAPVALLPAPVSNQTAA
jgi:hypothetical protein